VLTASAVAGRLAVFDGEIFDGETFDGETFDGETFDGETFDGETFDREGPLESVRVGSSTPAFPDEPWDETTKDARTASRASFCRSSSRGSWRIASSLWLRPPLVQGDTMPAARSSIVSADTLRASARDEMTEIDGRASPCSIWLRYGLEMLASSAAWRRVSRARRRWLRTYVPKASYSCSWDVLPTRSPFVHTPEDAGANC
jgi:hypothetical protein